MRSFEATAVLNGSRDAVWAFVTDPWRHPEWFDATRAVTYVSDDPIGLGTTYRERAALGPVAETVEWTVTGWEPPILLVVEGRPLAHSVAVALELRPAAGGTELRMQTVVGPPRGVGRAGAALLGLVAPALAASSRRSVRRAKAAFESGTDGTTRTGGASDGSR
jgi:uncharacterized protein YndB with AHSA1/START domain